MVHVGTKLFASFTSLDRKISRELLEDIMEPKESSNVERDPYTKQNEFQVVPDEIPNTTTLEKLQDVASLEKSQDVASIEIPKEEPLVSKYDNHEPTDKQQSSDPNAFLYEPQYNEWLSSKEDDDKYYERRRRSPRRYEEEKAPEDPPEIKRAKQKLIVKLNSMEKKGFKLSRPFAMSDSLEELQYELELHQAGDDTEAGVGMIKTVLGVLFAAMEWGASYLPFMKLNGFAAAMSAPETMSKFESAMERMYYKLWKRGGKMDPFLEVGILIVISALSFQFTNKSEKSTGSPNALGGILGFVPGLSSIGSKPSSSDSKTVNKKRKPASVVVSQAEEEPSSRPTEDSYSPPKERQPSETQGAVNGGRRKMKKLSALDFGEDH